MILALFLTACLPDDVKDDTAGGDTADADTDTDTDTDTDAGPGDLTGDWVSTGDDISPLFQSELFRYTDIRAHFVADGSYSVTATDADGATYDLAGTWVADDSTNPGSIVLTQASPYVATAEGIWQIADNVLTYEVVQTKPSYGFTPPTPETGFGSTAGPGLSEGDNTQIYRRI